MKTVINIKTDKDMKRDVQKLAKDIGLPLSSVVNAYLRQFLRTREVYFSVFPKMSKELEALLGRIEPDIIKRKNLSRSVSTKGELKEYLDSI